MIRTMDTDKDGNALYRALPSGQIPTLVSVKAETVNIGGTAKQHLHYEAICAICGPLTLSIEARSQGWQSPGDARDIQVRHMAAHLEALSTDLKDALR